MKIEVVYRHYATVGQYRLGPPAYEVFIDDERISSSEFSIEHTVDNAAETSTTTLVFREAE